MIFFSNGFKHPYKYMIQKLNDKLVKVKAW